MQVATRRQTRGDQLDEWPLHQAALVVALLGPGVGKVDMHAGQRAFGDHVTQHLHRVVLDDAQIGDAALLDQLAQAADARRMHLDTKEVLVRPGLGDDCGRLPHAETDLDDVRRLPPEYRIQVDGLRPVRDTHLRHHLVEETMLRIRHAPLAEHKTADRLGGKARARNLFFFAHAANPKYVGATSVARGG